MKYTEQIKEQVAYTPNCRTNSDVMKKSNKSKHKTIQPLSKNSKGKNKRIPKKPYSGMPIVGIKGNSKYHN